ncbi:response regulator [Poseidonibacter lekithochrous]|uniref:response regulator n=1 Tax=Poseidonibacter lekithochrous TaxID=1904463 RepID=UPI0008FCAABF|nr:response regulator [Poseidonibacter lekithochrous]QKJ22548.1 two-component system response regulator [Poseidonibacter lekithochrous]
MTKLMNFAKNDIEVLIVEDETVLAIGMEASLEDLGYEVSGIETTAQRAVNHANDNLPDIVIMDINLKGKDSGIEAAKQIWKKHKIPIVFLTSYSDDVTVKNAMESEPYGYLIKPCRDKDLDIAIKMALHKHNYFFKNKECLIDESIINLSENFKYDKAKRILFHNNKHVKLTGNEVKFFDILSEKPEESVSFDRILSFIYRDEYSDIGKLRTLVYRLRAKLEEELFENIYEFGYRLKLA